MLLHDKQKNVVRSKARFKIVRAGRRSGKSSLQVEDMSYTAVKEKDSPVFYIAPTQIQARAIIWEALKAKLALISEVNESRLEMKVPTQDGGYSLITVAGWENRENFRGRKAKKIYFDELDTMKDFFIGWQEIFRPALTDLKGEAMFSGTPKKENPNLKRLEKMAETDPDYEAFHFTTSDNPHIPREEIQKAKDELDYNTFRQEYLAEYVENQGSLFKFTALVDVFSNTITKENSKYLTVDIADDGSDKTIFAFWEGLEEYRREEFERLNTEGIIQKIREYASLEKIPYSQIAVDAVGVGAGVASSSLLDGIIGFKGSFAPIKTDDNIVMPNVSVLKVANLVSDYKNLRSQCIFTLADLVNNHKIASKVTGRQKENIIEELQHYQDVSTGDGKRMATQTEDIKAIIGRSPDNASTWLMRMYFVVMNKVTPGNSEDRQVVVNKMISQFKRNLNNMDARSNK